MRHQPTVLVIEQDMTLARLISEILEAKGYRVLRALGAASVMVARAEQPSVILLDLLSQEEQRLLQALKTDPATMHIPVITIGGTGPAHHKVNGTT